jgi:hypothetical protein
MAIPIYAYSNNSVCSTYNILNTTTEVLQAVL